MKHLFSNEGPLMVFLNKLGTILLINLLWIVGCIPILTIGTSSIAMYYAIVKVVRAERGYATKEFFHAYVTNLKKGIPLTIVTAILVVLFYLYRNYVGAMGNLFGVGMVLVYDVLAIFFVGMLCYIVPVLSRFQVSLLRYLKMTFVMSIRNIFLTVGLIVGFVGIVILIGYVPITVIAAPGIWCFLASFLTEKAMREFMPEPLENESAWYYDLGRKTKENSEERKEGE